MVTNGFPWHLLVGGLFVTAMVLSEARILRGYVRNTKLELDAVRIMLCPVPRQVHTFGPSGWEGADSCELQTLHRCLIEPMHILIHIIFKCREI